MTNQTADTCAARGSTLGHRVCRLLGWVMPLLLAAPGLGLVLYYIIGPARGYMTADCTDSLRWAYATYESGQLISDNFYYAAILPFGGNLIFLPFVALFGYSVKAQLCGLVLFALLLAGALYYLARGLEFGRCASAAFVSAVLLVLSGSRKLREIMWEHIFYYNLGILFFCVGFGLAVRLVHEGGLLHRGGERRAADYARLGVLLVFGLLAATNGLQSLICFTLPVLAAVFGERLLDGTEPLTSVRGLRTAGLLGAFSVCSAVGFLLIKPISHGVVAGYAEAFTSYSGMSEWTDNFLHFFENWFSLLGVSVKSGDPLLSRASIGPLVGIAGGVLLLLVPVAMLLGYRHMRSRGMRLLLIGHLVVSAAIMFGFVFGRLSGANWRLVPMLGTALIVTAAGAVALWRQQRVAARLGALLAAGLLLMAAVPAVQIAKMPSDYGRQNSWHVAAAELEARGLYYGYANFWWANLVSMLSDNRIEVGNLHADKTYPYPYEYQQPKDMYDDKDTDRYFLLLTEKEHTRMTAWLQAQTAAGNIIESFTIESEPYAAGGYYGSVLYVYVFAENLFGPAEQP
ncbi:MAG: hypothetical protein WDA00_07490 [Eubacteriales bacterium]